MPVAPKSPWAQTGAACYPITSAIGFHPRRILSDRSRTSAYVSPPAGNGHPSESTPQLPALSTNARYPAGAAQARNRPGSSANSCVGGVKEALYRISRPALGQLATPSPRPSQQVQGNRTPIPAVISQTFRPRLRANSSRFSAILATLLVALSRHGPFDASRHDLLRSSTSSSLRRRLRSPRP